jgi:predicted nucleic acid-binding protein
VDTAALLAIVDTKDAHHETAKEFWGQQVLIANFRSNNYVIVESIALIQNRLGLEAVRILVDQLLPVIEVDWLEAEQHELAIQSVLVANRRNLSLVDCSSFETMRRLGIKTVFTFDEHFREQGFNVIPNRSP